jgi:hypothetical protein
MSYHDAYNGINEPERIIEDVACSAGPTIASEDVAQPIVNGLSM